MSDIVNSKSFFAQLDLFHEALRASVSNVSLPWFTSLLVFINAPWTHFKYGHTVVKIRHIKSSERALVICAEDL